LRAQSETPFSEKIRQKKQDTVADGMNAFILHTKTADGKTNIFRANTEPGKKFYELKIKTYPARKRSEKC